MGQAIADTPICAPEDTPEVDPSPELKKRSRSPLYWEDDYVPGKPFFHAVKAERRKELFMTPHKLDPVEKRIWWECLKRNHPQVAIVLQDETAQELIKFFNASVVIPC